MFRFPPWTLLGLVSMCAGCGSDGGGDGAGGAGGADLPAGGDAAGCTACGDAPHLGGDLTLTITEATGANLCSQTLHLVDDSGAEDIHGLVLSCSIFTIEAGVSDSDVPACGPVGSTFQITLVGMPAAGQDYVVGRPGEGKTTVSLSDNDASELGGGRTSIRSWRAKSGLVSVVSVDTTDGKTSVGFSFADLAMEPAEGTERIANSAAGTFTISGQGTIEQTCGALR